MKIKKSIHQFVAILIAASLAGLVSGCKENDRSDLEEAAEEMADGIEDAADELKKD